MKKVAVLFGGNSCESEISVLTGTFVVNLLDRTRYEVLPVFVGQKGELYTSPAFEDIDAFKKQDFLKKAKRIFFDEGVVYEMNAKKTRVKRLFAVDVALNCCHGGLGEGGGVSALMQLNEIPLASPSIAASGVFMDKALTKLVVKSLGIPTLDYFRVNEEDYKKRGAFLLKNIARRLKFPVIVKPAHLGSSIGIAVAKNEIEAKAALETAFEIDHRVIIEKFLVGKTDVNCAAYAVNGEIIVSEAEAAFTSEGGVYGFDEKYLKKPGAGGKGGGRVALKGALRDKIRSYTRTVYKRLNLRGVVRIDYLVQGESVYLSEVNTVPGSLAYYLFCDRILEARAFFTELLEEAIVRAEREKKKILTTGILHTVRRAGK
ncbi:MAG: hypothetical protein IJX98_06795 [Clostridia bacterium]|nr:hypothetical protein [Clostridia bacterium]